MVCLSFVGLDHFVVRVDSLCLCGRRWEGGKVGLGSFCVVRGERITGRELEAWKRKRWVGIGMVKHERPQTIAIVGFGNFGQFLAKTFVKQGHR